MTLIHWAFLYVTVAWLFACEAVPAQWDEDGPPSMLTTVCISGLWPLGLALWLFVDARDIIKEIRK